ncbi:hypothetical protein P7C70_g7717, partial [Phenoliferia sp. Uapishka_3]
MVTPMCTQLTYEGLVDEVVGIKNAHVQVDPALLAPSNAPTPTPSSSTFPTPLKKRKHLLTSTTDPLFAQLRDKNFAVVGAILNKTARRLNEDYERRHKAKSTAELRAFVGQLGGLQAEHQALRLHTGLTEQILATTSSDEFNAALEIQQSVSLFRSRICVSLRLMHYFQIASDLIAGVEVALQESLIRDLINQEAPLPVILRLLILYSIIQNGIKKPALEDFKLSILQTYGYQHLPLLLSLASQNLLNPPPKVSAKSAFVQARKPLRLVVDDVDESEPGDVAYVFSGYAPLSVR